MIRIAVIDYGSGNLRSVAKALAHVSGPREEIVITQQASDVAQADRILLPGVGAFADCMHGLASLPDMIPALTRRVHEQSVPFLGICVGMQLLAAMGFEHQPTPGLGWIKGEVRALTPPPNGKIPHMGWNTLTIQRPNRLFAGIDDGTHMYFVHSYHLEVQDDTAVVATTDYGRPITAAIGQHNIVGTQFHPEKSQQAGMRILRNFLDWGDAAA